MTIHSDSFLWGMIAFALTGVTMVVLLVSLSSILSKKYTRAGKLAAAGVGLAAIYVLAFNAMTPQKIVSIGDSYCADIWCIRIDKVSAAPNGPDMKYQVEVHIFSDANRVQTSAKGYTIYLSDDQGRRFPLVPDPAVVPFDATLNPGQAVNTSLTFVAASDAKHLYLMGDAAKPTPAWVGFLSRLYSGGDSKPALIRVL